MKKEIPILFSTPMVQAILEGRKTMTRRIVKPQPDHEADAPVFMPNAPALDWEQHYKQEWKPWTFDTAEGESIMMHCPYGKPGDILWVRETLYQEGELALYYLADNEQIDEEIIPEDYKPYRNYACCKVPNIHMQKSVARIWLEVTKVRIERLQDISERDARAEGVERKEYEDFAIYKGYSGPAVDGGFTKAKFSFETLWEKINGEESWNQNPWVWVVSFKVLSTTGKPYDKIK